VDIYSGYFGIGDNTPARFRANARIAGVADRVDEVKVGDMRKLPFGDAAFDAAVSTYAVDHIPRRDIPVALREIARVLKPGSAFLLGIVNPDVWVRSRCRSRTSGSRRITHRTRSGGTRCSRRPDSRCGRRGPAGDALLLR
jgi:SAM-dependent methyltransferase